MRAVCRGAAAWQALRPRRAYATAAPADTGMDRDPRCYLLSNQDLVYLKSPRSLMFKAETASELASELMLGLNTARDDPLRCLTIIDSVSAILCLTLDACEATRSTHPKEEFRGHADTAFQFLQKHTDALNSERALVEPLVKLCSEEVWPTLTPVQKHLVNVYKSEMESLGVHLSPARAALAATLNRKVDTAVDTCLNIEGLGQDPEIALSELLASRHELASVIGYDSYLSWSLKNCVAENPLDIWKLLLSFSERLQEAAREDMKKLIDLRQAIPFRARSIAPGKEFDVHDYELRELISLKQREDYPNAAKEAGAYLTIGNAWRGLEIMCHEVLGVRLVKIEGLAQTEQYEKNVVKFEIVDEKTELLLGVVYADMIDRETKARGSGHFTVQVGSAFDETLCLDLDLLAPESGKITPIVIFSCSVEPKMVEEDEGDDTTEGTDQVHVPPPQSRYAYAETKEKKTETTNWEMVKLSPDELVSMYHEFGHAMHSVLGQTKYQSLSGTRGSLDYVETFSQLFEMYARDYRSLKRYAIHPKTREAIPKYLVDNMNAMESTCGSLLQLGEIVTACVDLVYHGPRPLTFFALDKDDKETMHAVPIPDGHEHPAEVRKLVSDAISPLVVTELGSQRMNTTQYLLNYPANYYSYTYSRILATAIWQQHFDKDPFSKAAGQKLRKALEYGASAPPAVMLQGLLDDISPERILASL
eukprot:TRINITY_DN20241_c0_g1_i1.p1 TRINITY_DN20241_c0_g1~~TRINITY_DN20241_c0_g1_i1.p1  ORF type:complete len:705 (+),score=262.64 TRINITY_DN20241_c0_g1_i1:64-2178(+)